MNTLVSVWLFIHLFTDGISKTLLHNQEWSLIIKQQILFTLRIPVCWGLSIVLTAIPDSEKIILNDYKYSVFDYVRRFNIDFLAIRLIIWSNRLTSIPCRLMISLNRLTFSAFRLTISLNRLTLSAFRLIFFTTV